MILLSQDNFPRVGRLQIPGDVVAVSIAQSSDVDRCLVNGRMLGVGGIVPCTGGAAESVQGWATGLNLPLAVGSDNYMDVNGLSTPLSAALVLVGWQCGDRIAPPTRRAPRQFPVEIAPVDIFGGYKCVLRAPFFGRSVAKIALHCLTETATDIVLRAVTYHDRDLCEAMSRPSIAVAPSRFVMPSFVVESKHDPIVTPVVSNVDASLPYYQSVIYYWQGECADELQLWMQSASNAVSDAGSNYYLNCEIYGERSHVGVGA